MKHFAFTSLGIALCLTACGDQNSSVSQQPVESAAAMTSENDSTVPAGPAVEQETFFAHLALLCGQSFEGRLVSDDPVDQGTEWATANMIMHVRDCSDDEIRIPLHVGENRSRTWVVSRTETGLRLKHDHRHEDGEPDVVTWYGGDTASAGTAGRQEFPVDDYSKELFLREGLDVSVDNTWALEVKLGEMFAYELSRPNRFFRGEFDLSQPVDTPPSAWGYAEE